MVVPTFWLKNQEILRGKFTKKCTKGSYNPQRENHKIRQWETYLD